MNAEHDAYRPGPLKAVGYLNLVVGTFLLLLGGGCLWTTGPFLAENSPFRLDPELTRNVLTEMRRQMIADARKTEGSAPDAASKARGRAARERLEALRGDTETRVDFEKINQTLPWLSHYLWADVLSGPALNLLLVVSGAGLLLRKPWGRRLAVWTALLKIARLAVLSALLGIVVVPSLKQTLGEFAATDVGRGFLRQAIDSRNAAGMQTADLSPDEFVAVFTTMGYAYAVFSLALGAIYPAIMLVVLARSEARTVAGDPDPPPATLVA